MKKTDLSLNSLAKLRADLDLAAAYVAAAGNAATEKQKAKVERLTAELKRVRPLVLKANADRFPAHVLAAWLADDKAAMISEKTDQVKAAAEKHAAAVAAYPALAAADTAARAAYHAAGGFNRAPAELVNAERAARNEREHGERMINSTAAMLRRRERELNALRNA